MSLYTVNNVLILYNTIEHSLFQLIFNKGECCVLETAKTMCLIVLDCVGCE